MAATSSTKPSWKRKREPDETVSKNIFDKGQIVSIRTASGYFSCVVEERNDNIYAETYFPLLWMLMLLRC